MTRLWGKAPEGRHIMAHTFTRLLSHIIFSTKDRLPQIDPELKLELYPYMGGVLKELDAVSLAINGPADHVHILASMPATRTTSDILRVLKANSSKWVHKKLRPVDTLTGLDMARSA
jgi:putative transposase